MSATWGKLVTAYRTARFLVTCRKAFPWWLQLLLVVGCIQIPVLPTDEICLAAAVLVLVFHPRYRRVFRVCRHAALMEV
jgi:hypothetical protein